MIAKKNPKADLNRFRFIFFQLGLILTLGATYIGINWTFSESEYAQDTKIKVEQIITEDIPITDMKTPVVPPPPPPPVPEVIEVVEDDLEIEETEIESTETSLDEKMEEVVQVADIEEEGLEESIEEVPFVLVAKVPVYPGCENQTTNEARKKCMSDNIQQLVKHEFNINLGAELGLSGFHRIFVVFKIDHNGKVTDIKSRGPHKALEEEAERVIKMIPPMTPGYQRNRPVSVIYNLPITFEVRTNS